MSQKHVVSRGGSSSSHVVSREDLSWDILLFGILSYHRRAYCHGAYCNCNGNIVTWILLWDIISNGILVRSNAIGHIVIIGIFLWGLLSWAHCYQVYCHGYGYIVSEAHNSLGCLVSWLIIASASADVSADLSADIPENRFWKLKILLKHSRTF